MGDVSVRVGDAERRVVDDRLMASVGDDVLTLAEYDERAAVLWQARTRAELEALVVDLPGAPSPRPAPPARSGPREPAPASGNGGLLARLRGVGVGGVLALGAVGVLASGTDERVLFGSGTETVTGDEQSVAVSWMFGSVQVVVPDDAVVDVTGFSPFGSVACADACDGVASTPGARTVPLEVRAVGLFGSASVLTVTEAAQRERDLRDAVEDARDAAERAVEDARDAVEDD